MLPLSLEPSAIYYLEKRDIRWAIKPRDIILNDMLEALLQHVFSINITTHHLGSLDMILTVV